MFMKNGIILSIADRIKDALPIPTDEFRKRLEEDCYVIWKLPQFYIRQITQSSIIPTCTDYIEAKNAEVHGAYGFCPPLKPMVKSFAKFCLSPWVR